MARQDRSHRSGSWSGAQGGVLRLIVVLLVGSAFVSGFPVAAEVLVGLAALVALCALLSSGSWHAPAGWAVAFIVYWSVSLLVVNAAPDPSDLVRWLNDDGRILVGLFPFVFLATARPTDDDVAFLRAGAYALILCGLGLLAAGLAGMEPGTQLMDGTLFFGLTSSHHVPGYIYGTIFILLFAYRDELHPGRWRAGLVASLLLVGASGSRTTLVALGVAGVWYLLREAGISQRLKAVIAIPAIAVLLFMAVPQVGNSSALVSRDSIAASRLLFESGREATSFDRLPQANAGLYEVYNAQERFALFGFAWGRFLDSPVIGIGSTRFDDSQTQYAGVHGVIDLALRGTDQPDYKTAHNQYLHLLAENGFVGLALFLALWASAYRRLAGAADRRLRIGGVMLIMFALGTGLTGATLEASSLTFEVGTAIMLLLGRLRLVADRDLSDGSNETADPHRLRTESRASSHSAAG